MATTAFDPIQYKATTHKQWQAVAAAWNRWGPVLGEWLAPATEVMLDLAGVGPGSRVLDLAAGAGEQTLVAARRVGPTGSILATDISANLLAFAQQAVHDAGLSNVTTRMMDAEDIDLPDDSFDAAISRLGLMYFPNLGRALSGVRRVLKPETRFAAIVFSPPDQNRFFSMPVAIVRRRAHLPPPQPGQPGPFSLGSPGVLQTAFAEAGYRTVQVRRVSAPLRLPSAQECLRFERESFGALHQMLAGLPAEEQAATWHEIGEALREFEGPTGFEAPSELLVAAGVK